MTGGSLALVGARVVPVTAPPIEGGTVLVADGRIVAVGGSGLPVPSGAERIDVAGKWVLPGLVDAHTYVGLQEDGNGAAGADQDEVTEPNGARFRVSDGVNPADPAFRDAVVGGVLAAGISAGTANPIGGQAVAVRCHGRTFEDMVLRDPCGVTSALGEEPRSTGAGSRVPGTRMGTAAVIREAFVRARRYVERGETGDVAADLGSAALARVLEGEIPWRQHAHRADDLATAIRLADEFGYRLVVLRGTDAESIADRLAERDIPVVLGPLMTSRRRAEMSGRSLRTAGRLAAAGVRLALTTRHYTNPIHTLPHQAAFAVREGLDRATALAAITVVPAEILGIADRVGSLEAGKDADLCVWSGDPFDVAHRVEVAYVQGRRVYEYDQRREVGLFGTEEWTL